jgi:ATP-dependent RNA helicase DeaD
MLDQAGIDAIWEPAPQADEIRKRDQARMLQDDLFTEAPTEDDLIFARALLAERSPDEIATALARLYRSRLPSPEDILDSRQGEGRARGTRGEREDSRHRRADERGPDRSKTKPSSRPMSEGSVWFRAAIGRRKKAEARWLLPMICRRGGIDKHDIGAIRIFETTTEFEISAPAAEAFAARIKRPDKDDNIVIEAVPGGSQGHAPADQGARNQVSKDLDSRPRHKDKPRPDNGPKHHGRPRGEAGPSGKPESETGRGQDDKSGYKGKHRRHGAAPFSKPSFGKKPNKNRHRG